MLKLAQTIFALAVLLPAPCSGQLIRHQLDSLMCMTEELFKSRDPSTWVGYRTDVFSLGQRIREPSRARVLVHQLLLVVDLLPAPTGGAPKPSASSAVRSDSTIVADVVSDEARRYDSLSTALEAVRVIAAYRAYADIRREVTQFLAHPVPLLQVVAIAQPGTGLTLAWSLHPTSPFRDGPLIGVGPTLQPPTHVQGGVLFVGWSATGWAPLVGVDLGPRHGPWVGMARFVGGGFALGTVLRPRGAGILVAAPMPTGS